MLPTINASLSGELSVTTGLKNAVAPDPPPMPSEYPEARRTLLSKVTTIWKDTR